MTRHLRRQISRPRTPVVLGLAAVLALLAAAAAAAIYQHNPGWMYDARVYRSGGSVVLQGRDLYRSLPPPAFTYTPFAALLFVPLALLPMHWIGIVGTGLSILCLEGSVWLALGRPPIGRDRRWALLWIVVTGLAVWLDPVSLTLLLGQVNLVLMFVVLLDLSLPDASPFKGIGTGLAAGIKLTPAFFILYLAATRRLRAASVAAASFAATAAIGFMALPADSLRYWGGTFLDSSRVGDPQNVRSQSLRSLLVRWAHTGQGILPAWAALALAVAVAALLLALWAHRRGEELLAVCLCATATLLISPITWQHHWVWMLPLLLWLAQRAWRRRSRLLWGVCAAIAVEFYARPYQWGIPVDRVADLHLGTLQLLQSSTYAVTALLVLALAGLILWQDRRVAAVTGSRPERPTRRPLPRIEPEAGPGRR